MEICHFCGNTHLTETRTQYTYKRGNHYLIIQDVPCVRCDYCGEQYFQASVLKQIEYEFEAIYAHGKQPKKQILVPVEGFAELEIA